MRLSAADYLGGEMVDQGGDIFGTLILTVLPMLMMGAMFGGTYNEDTGYPTPHIESLGAWLFWGTAVGVAIMYFFHPFFGISFLAFAIPFIFACWDAGRPHNVAAYRRKQEEAKQKKAAEEAAAETARLRKLAEEDEKKRAEEAAARLRELEAAFPSVAKETYRTSSPGEITETAKKLAAQLRQR